jgi:4a-hydroxytetrahydrobiopterin dehydratase
VSRPVRLEDSVIENWLEANPRWRREGDRLVLVVGTADYPGAVALLQAQIPLAQRLDHHPIATVGYRELRLELWTHDRGGITELDLEYGEEFETLLARYHHLLS